MKIIRHRHKSQDADLDITAFMNLMIVLVPVLLMSMVFSHVSIIELKLPEMSASSDNDNKLKDEKLELIIRKAYLDVNFPAGIRLKRIPYSGETYDYKALSIVLQEIKRRLKEKGVYKKDIIILSEADTDYQTLVTAMDTSRSFKAVVAADVVDAELFPQISLGDAPVLEASSKAGGAK